MEENKEKNGCEHGSCNGYGDKKDCCCCHHCHRHHGRGFILRIVLYVLVFGVIINLVCSLFGFDHSNWERGNYRGYMMDYRYGPKYFDLQNEPGSFNIKVNVPDKTDTGTTTPQAPAKQ